MRNLVIAVALLACLVGGFLAGQHQASPKTDDSESAELRAVIVDSSSKKEFGQCRNVVVVKDKGSGVQATPGAVPSGRSAGLQSIASVVLPEVAGIIKERIKASGGRWVNRLNSLSSTVDELRQSCTPGTHDKALEVAERALVKHIEDEYLKKK